MENKIIIQHYVPRFYLKNFTITKKNNYLINCYDKIDSKKFIVSIKRIACEKDFYDKTKEEIQLIENYLAHFESDFSYCYNKIIEHEDLSILNDEEKTLLSIFITIQWIRTKEHREKITDTIRQLTKELSIEKLPERIKKQLEQANTDEYIRKFQNRNLLLDIPKIANIIFHMKWVLFINKINKPFWTSDNPITLFNHIDHSPYGSLGLLKKGIQMHFPLSPKLNLCICDPEMFKLLPEKSFINNQDEIIFQNHLQVNWSTRHIFSIDSDFSLAEKMLNDNPELGKINRKRIIIH